MKPSDSLLLYVDRLEQALAEDAAGREHEWSEQTLNLLDGLQRALGQHDEAAQGMFTKVDLLRLSRRMGELCQQHHEFLKRTRAVREEVEEAERAFQPLPTFNPEITPLPGTIRAVPDFGKLREHGRALLRDLRRHLDEETGLVLEGVTTDIGAGD
jgi:hypothetical protein